MNTELRKRSVGDDAPGFNAPRRARVWREDGSYCDGTFDVDEYWTGEEEYPLVTFIHEDGKEESIFDFEYWADLSEGAHD